MAITDPLTGLYNPRGLSELGRREIDRARRFNRPLSAIFLDLDDFKEVNDTYGHVNGDQVLISLANACRQNIREVDIIGRMGGDEFVVLLPETELKSACQVAERLRRFTEQMRITTEIAQIQVTASLGVGLYTEEMKDLATLIDQADMAMYAAKQAGKNRVMDCHAVQGN